MKLIFSIILILLFSISGFAQKADLNGFSVKDSKGKEWKLSDFKSKSEGIVIIFSDEKCPYTTYYKGRVSKIRMKALDLEMSFLEVFPESSNSNGYYDNSSKNAARIFGVKKYPQAFLVSLKGTPKIIYSGAIDGNPQAAPDVKNNFLENALNQFAKGSKIGVSSTRPVGCSVR